MKKAVLLSILCFSICTIGFAQQTIEQPVFYLAKYLRSQYSSVTKTIPLDANVKAALNKEIYKKIVLTKEILNANPFFENLFDDAGGVSAKSFAGGAINSIGGLDVTKFANAISDIMIERAKQELTIAFFDRFKKFAKNNPEFQILFPKSTENLGNLLSYKYPQMLPALRDGFFEDLKQITYHLDDVLALPRYRKLLNNFPEIRIAIRSLRLVHEIETGASNAADIIKEFTLFEEWKNTSNNKINSVGSCLKIACFFSESIRNDTSQSHTNDVWVQAKEVKELFYDEVFFNIYMGLLYQQAINKDLEYIALDGTATKFSEILKEQKKDLFLFQNKLKEFFDLTGNVNAAFKDLQQKIKNNDTPSNDDIYNYINTSVDVVEYGFSIVKVFNEKDIADDYLKIIRTSNNLYKNSYTKQYTLAINNTLDILIQLHDLTNSNTQVLVDGTPEDKKTALGNLISFVKKVKPYALFMANMVEAKDEAAVKAALENVILPVGSSSIKKNTVCNVSVQTYLGAYLSTTNGSTSSVGAWSDKFGVTAPIGISFTPGFLSFKKAGAVSLFGALFDLGAIVDYKLTQDSATGPVSKDYKVKLGNIFSPGVYAVYGFPWDLPLSLGFGAQYGPGLSKIDGQGKTVIGNPAWRCNFFLAVDLTFFTLTNKTKDQ